ncbi:hypothetical protein [Streptomyces sp. NPDC001758]
MASGWDGGHAEVDLAGHAGELVLGRGDGDLQPFDLAEPAALVGLGQAVAEVGDDLVEPTLLGRVGLQERAPQAGFSEPTRVCPVIR